MGNVAVSPLSKKLIRERAYNLRMVLGLSQQLYLPIDRILEVLSCPFGDEDPLLNLEILPDYEMCPEYAAAYSPHKNLLQIRESVYIGGCEGNARDRFTMAHELGHYCLHRSQDYQLARSNAYVPSYRDPEWQANTFASELLMPNHLIQGMQVEDVMRMCGTSRQAAEIALKR